MNRRSGPPYPRARRAARVQLRHQEFLPYGPPSFPVCSSVELTKVEPTIWKPFLITPSTAFPRRGSAHETNKFGSYA
jgi:hypothetical protein